MIPGPELLPAASMRPGHGDPEGRLTRLSSLVEIGKVLSSSLDLPAILETVYGQMGRLFDVANFYIAICDEHAQEWEMALHFVRGEPRPLKGGHPAATGFTGWLIRTRQSVVFPTAEDCRAFAAREGDLGLGERPLSLMGVPLVAGDRVMGAMVVQSLDHEVHYRPQDLEFFETVGTQVAIAIQNARLFKASADKVTDLSVLLEISRALSANIELEPLLETVYREVGRIFETGDFYIATHEKGSDEWIWAFYMDHGVRQPRSRYGLDTGLTGYILRTGESLLFGTGSACRAFLEEHGVTGLGPLAKSWMGVPLLAGDYIAGVLNIQSYEIENAYDQEDLALFTTIASQVASAVRNAQLYKEATRRAEAMASLAQHTEIARRISEQKDYSLRLHSNYSDEIGTLTQSLNEMLQQIQIRDAQLLDYQNHLEEQVASRSEDLMRANTQALLAKERAEEASRAKSLFLANMSHELRTPLNAILLYSELMMEEAAERGLAEFQDDLKKIRVSGKHLLSLIDNILDLSKIEAGRMTAFLEDVDLAALFRNVATTVQPLMEKNGNQFVFQDRPAIPSLHTDLKKLSQVLYNLLNNAAKFTSQGLVTLSVEADEDPSRVVFTVRDTGIGMNTHEVGRLFQEFTQADESTTRLYSGTGLGLAICRRLTELLGGQIWVESEPGRGSSFHVRLPVAGAVVPDAASHITSHGGTVLVIDDDFTMRDALSRLLTPEGLWVAVATDGVEGLQMARTLHPDVIALDLLMPGVDGWSVLHRLRAEEALKTIPVLVLTGKDLSGEEVSRLHAAGVQTVLRKGTASKDELLALFRRCTGNRS